MNGYWFTWETDVPDREQTENLIREVLDAGLAREGISVPVEVSITVTTAEEVHAINREYRGVDRTTDVLSFPMVEYPGTMISAAERLQAVQASEADPDTDCIVLGDIILNYEQAGIQAEEYGHSLRREIAFLTIHSLLHLLGYDHMEEAEENLMREHQAAVLNELQITR